VPRGSQPSTAEFGRVAAAPRMRIESVVPRRRPTAERLEVSNRRSPDGHGARLRANASRSLDLVQTEEATRHVCSRLLQQVC
jgi:hypothetical protein